MPGSRSVAKCASAPTSGQQGGAGRDEGEAAGGDVARRRLGQQLAGEVGADGDGERQRQERDAGAAARE